MLRRSFSSLNAAQRFARSILLGLAMTVGTAAIPTDVLAQGELPVNALSLSDDQKAQIGKYITDNSANLGSNDVKLVKGNRSHLVEPLQSTNVSAAFRLEYSRQLHGKLTPLVSNANDVVAINSAVIAGELATDEGIDILMAGLSSNSASVRYQVAAGARRTFEALQTSAEALSNPFAEKLVNALADRLGYETDVHVVDGLVRALLAAGSVSKASYTPIRTLAVSKLCQNLPKRAEFTADKPAPAVVLQSALTACGGLRDQIAGAPGSTALTGDGLKESAIFAGHMLAHCSRVARTGSMPPMNAPAGGPTPVRDLYAQLAQLAQTVLLSAGRSMSPQFQAPGRELAAKLRLDNAKGDAEFAEDITQLVGIISRPPFDVPAGTFKLR